MAEQGVHVVSTDDVRKPHLLFRVRDLIVKPALLQRFDIQKLQSTAVYLYRAGADVMVVEQIEEILANLLGAELGRRGVEMLSARSPPATTSRTSA